MASDKPKSACGHDYQYLTPPPQELVCLVCKLVARKAHQTNCCKGIFCKGCLKKLEKCQGVFNCPGCQDSLLPGRCHPDTQSQQKIGNLRLYCSNRTEGCQWTGMLREVLDHTKSCQHRMIECSNCCVIKVKQMDLARHLEQECAERMSICGHCGDVGKHLYITDAHLKECPDVKVNCPNTGCTDLMKRNELPQHHLHCSYQIVQCEYADIGCTYRAARKDIKIHLEKAVHHHLLLSKSRIQELRLQNMSQPGKSLIKVTQFSYLQQSGGEWHSPGFYTFPGGYKMSLHVIIRGDRKQITCGLCLLPGEHDDLLEWPLRGEFTLELLNQIKDSHHYSKIVKYTNNEETEYNSRVIGRENGKRWGFVEFISHPQLQHTKSTNCQYLMNDTLYFRVTAIKVNKSQSKPWLYC